MKVRTMLLIAAGTLGLLGAVSNADAAFVRQALASGRAEIAEARIQLRSPDPNVRYYASSMIVDYGAIDGRLVALAKRLGISVAGVLPSPAPERSLSPIAYLRDQAGEDRKALAAYRHEASHGTDARVRALAKTDVTVLQSHVSLARKLLYQEEGKSTLTAPISGFSSPPAPSPAPAPASPRSIRGRQIY